MVYRVNYWWALPVISGLAGIFGALQLFPKSHNVKLEAPQVVTGKSGLQSLNTVASLQTAPLLAKTVAMPPAPKIAAAQYQAELVNNRVRLKSNLATTEPITEEKSKPVSLEQLATQGEISPELANRFTQALAEMAADEAKTEQSGTLHPQALTKYPQWYQDLVPAMEFSSHIYSSNKSERWVKVNQQVVKEGELINADLRLLQITPEQVIIEMQQRQFILPALSSW